MARIYAVASGKGGVGKSTFTAGISKALSSLGKRVLAIDCDIGLRSLDLLLGCDEQVVFDWGDGILGRCTPDRAVISGDVDFIAAPRKYDEDFSGKALRDMLGGLSDKYDYVFFDAPAGVGKSLLALTAGLYHLKNGNVSKIIVIVPTVEASEATKIGLLPGTIEEKT